MLELVDEFHLQTIYHANRTIFSVQENPLKKAGWFPIWMASQQQQKCLERF